MLFDHGFTNEKHAENVGDPSNAYFVLLFEFYNFFQVIT